MNRFRFLRKDLNYGPIPPELAGRLRDHDLDMETPDPAKVDGATVNWGERDYLSDLKASAR